MPPSFLLKQPFREPADSSGIRCALPGKPLVQLAGAGDVPGGAAVFPFQLFQKGVRSAKQEQHALFSAEVPSGTAPAPEKALCSQPAAPPS